MQLSRKQMKNFNRINQKLKTNSSFFVTNHNYLVKKYSYLKQCHAIVKCELKLKKRRVVLPFNQLIKLGLNRKVGKKFRPKKMQKRCHVRGKSNAVQGISLLKRQSDKANEGSESVRIENSTEKIAPEKSNDDQVSTVERDEEEKTTPTTTEDVNEQIREQLKLLQSGRRSSISLLPSGSVSRPSSVIGTKTSSCNSTPSFSRHPSHSSIENDAIRSIDANSVKPNDLTTSSQNQSNQKPKFIDSLISKLKTQGLNLPNTIDENQSLSAHTSPDKSTTSLPQKSFTDCGESSMEIVMDDEDHMSDHSASSKNDFLGFKEIDAQFELPNIPGMLPTPLVKRSKGVKSAFVSEYLDNFMKENALDNSAYRTAPLKKRPDEAMMYAEAKPPNLLCPQLPSDVEKPRTVAEKRQLLERKADIKYLMIENESTVYRELKKHAKTGPAPNYTLIRNIQQMNIPFTRDCWRATCWLNTSNGRFYYQTIKDHGKDIKVQSGRGNNSVKELVKLKPFDKKKFATNQQCNKSCRLIGNIKINGLDDFIAESAITSQQTDATFTSKKLNTLSDDYSFRKPGPLSLKKLNPIKSAMDVELGPLELYHLPHIQLEVWPKLDRPLPPDVHPYLKLALPYEKITTEWAEFALSTLKQNTPSANRRKRHRTIDTHQSYTFTIPYTNNQNRIMVRKRRKIVPTQSITSINENEQTELNFRKDVDVTDDVAVDCADVLTGMINSVALSMCEVTVVKDDPDIDYTKVDGELSGVGKPVDVHSVKITNTPAGKVVKELKKLNAKIIHGFDTVKKEECRNDFCKLGCICDSLRGAQTYSYHCKEIDCMFECKCPSSKINTSTFESAVHNSDIKQFCDRMNQNLAKVEKDFTATVVVSDGKTIYVPTWDEKKKRSKKVPKRLSDCVQFESDFVHRDIGEMHAAKKEKRMRASKMEDVIDVDDRALMTNRNEIVKNMVHVNVNVERLNILDDLQPWCMVHCLYKCFCKLRAIDGRRFEFGDTKIDAIEEPTYTKKRQYTFERSTDEPSMKVARYTDTIHLDEDYSSCRRVRVVATNHHSIVNRARSVDVNRRVRKFEKDRPGLRVLLRNRVKRSIALADVGPMVSVNDSTASNERKSIAEPSIENRMKPKEESVDDSIQIDENASNKYRSRFNNIVMKTMQGISSKLKTMTTLPSPANKAFYYMQWKHFLDAFNSDRIFIWEVQLNTTEVLLVVTDKNIMPIVSNAMYVINIKALSTERLPLLPKLIKLGVMNDETEKMSILLFGVSNYWRVIGCTHSVNDFMNNRVVAVPTPDANPRLATKISSLFNDMVKLTVQNRSKPSSITSNICIRQLDVYDIDNIQVPIPVVGSHRWLMLSLAADFSHIYVPNWKQFISYEKIISAMDQAKKSLRTVRWGPPNLKPQVYVPHNSDMKIFFGPLLKNESLELQLLQHYDGKMILREDYQRMAQQKPNGLTFGTWLYMKDDHVSDTPMNAKPIRTYPPKLRYFAKKPEPSVGFVPLKSPALNANNVSVTLLSPASSNGFSNRTTSTPLTSGTAPSSELIRQLSLGLRARPSKTSNSEHSPIKVVDTRLLMSPKFLSTESQSPSQTAIEAKPVTLSVAPTMDSKSDWKDITKGVPIRTRRFTSDDTKKPLLKTMLEKSIVADKQSHASDSTAKRIRERRYTTIISTGGKPMHTKTLNQFTNVPNVKTVPKKPTSELTLIPIVDNRRTSNKPVIIKKIHPTNSILRQSSGPITYRPLSPSNKQAIVKPITLSSSKPSTISPVIVVKPSNLPPKVTALGGKSIVIKKINPQMLRLVPSNVKIVGQNKVIKPIPDTIKIIKTESDAAPSSSAASSSSTTHAMQPPRKQQQTAVANHLSTGTNNTVNGYLISQVLGLGKIMAKRLFAAYSVNLLGGSKLFHTFQHCVDYLNNVYMRERVFAMVPAHLDIEWRFVANDDDHSDYDPHNEQTLRPSMVLTKDELIDLNSNFDTNDSLPMDLRHHLLVLRLAHACMRNHEARRKTGLEIVRKSEVVIKELKVKSTVLENDLRALRTQKRLNYSKLTELKKKMNKMMTSGMVNDKAVTSTMSTSTSSTSTSTMPTSTTTMPTSTSTMPTSTSTSKKQPDEIITIDSDDE